MEDGIEITLNDEAISVKGDSREAWPYRLRPRNLQRMGAARQAGEVSIIMSAELLDKLKAYAATDLSRELGGVLLGQLLSDEDGRYILIEGEIEARFADSKRASLTFTHQTWEYINQVKEKDYPDKRIVGWYHTHPGFGVFLSEYDQFIQRNFFNLPWQIALVLDPLKKDLGFFHWENGAIACCEGWELIAKEAPLAEKTTAAKEQPAVKIHIDYIVVALLGMMVALVMLGFGKVQELDKGLDETRTQIESLRQELQNKPQEAQMDHTIKIRVLAGDTIWALSQRFYGESNPELTQMLLEANNLSKPADLKEGQTFVLPNKD